MCLAIPGKIVELFDALPPFASAKVEFGGVCREVSVACVPDVAIGEYVMVHAGIAISRVDADEAARVLETLQELDLGEELDLEEVPLPEGGTTDLGAKPT